MRNILAVILITTIILSSLLAQETNMFFTQFVDKGHYYLLNLTYKIDNECDAIFDADTPLAIEIVEINADGEKLSFIDDMDATDGRTYWKLKPLTENQTMYYISMFWYKKSSNSIRWNDGTGLYFTEEEPGLFKPNTNSYELTSDMERIGITYKIKLPDVGMASSGGLPLELHENRYSDTYSIQVDLSSIWND